MPSWLPVLYANALALLGWRTYLTFGGIALLFTVDYLMRPRRVYFVRHGETKANAEHVRQAGEGPLSPRGREQAAAAGEYLAAFPIRAIVSSPYERAAETAAIISRRLKLPISYSPLLVERRNPSEVVGRKDDSPEVIAVIDRIDRIYHDDDYRYSDEENFADIKERAKELLDLLARQGPHDLVAITHSIFLKMVIAYLLARDDLHAGDYAKLSFYNASDNAGITVTEYNPWLRFSATRGWRIVDYNIAPYQDAIANETAHSHENVS